MVYNESCIEYSNYSRVKVNFLFTGILKFDFESIDWV